MTATASSTSNSNTCSSRRRDATSTSTANNDNVDILQLHLRLLSVRSSPPAPDALALFQNDTLPRPTDYANRQDFVLALLDEAIKICDEPQDVENPSIWLGINSK